MVLHRARARREEGDVGAALPLKFQLRAFERFADLIVADAQIGRAARKLRLAPIPERRRRGRVVSVDIDDHVNGSFHACSGASQFYWNPVSLLRIVLPSSM